MPMAPSILDRIAFWALSSAAERAPYKRVTFGSIPAGPTNGAHLIWDSSGTLYSDYDNKHDVLYISKGASCTEYAEEDNEFGESLWLRRSEETNDASGVTIFGATMLDDTTLDGLIDRVALFLDTTEDAVVSQFGERRSE